MQQAIDIAVSKAGIERYRVISLPEQPDPLEQFVKQLAGEMKANVLEKELGAYYQQLKNIKQMAEKSGIWARLPFEMYIK